MNPKLSTENHDQTKNSLLVTERNSAKKNFAFLSVQT